MGIVRTLTTRAALASRFGLVAVLAMLAMPAPAGDEVDYSAPYLTVENGELVTRYPARAHEEASADREPAPPDEEASRVVPAVLALLLCFGVGVVLLRRMLARRSGRG